MISEEQIKMLNEMWEDNEATTALYEVISGGDIEDFVGLLSKNPPLAHIRSKDGRGPMFWAHENGQVEMVEILRRLGVSDTE